MSPPPPTVDHREHEAQQTENPADDGEFTGKAGLVWFRRSHGQPGFQRLKELDLSSYGTEVYDVALL